jgi:hypothetical protein
MRELARAVPFVALSAIGLAAGIWILVSPWVLGYPASAGWTASTWTAVWVGGLVAAVSAVSVVVVLAHAVHRSLHPERAAE